jgi:hypothetical protein
VQPSQEWQAGRGLPFEQHDDERKIGRIHLPIQCLVIFALGVRGELRNMAGSGHGPWHLARSKAPSVGLSNAHLPKAISKDQ